VYKTLVVWIFFALFCVKINQSIENVLSIVLLFCFWFCSDKGPLLNCLIFILNAAATSSLQFRLVPSARASPQEGVPDQRDGTSVDAASRLPATRVLPANPVPPPQHAQHRVLRAQHQAQGAARAGQHQARALQTGV
jgi:hypothetical protein